MSEREMYIINTIRILIFAVLAIVFNKWWIVLISTFFLLFKEDKL